MKPYHKEWIKELANELKEVCTKDVDCFIEDSNEPTAFRYIRKMAVLESKSKHLLTVLEQAELM